jgi:proteasome lid subunit RPN8/RPN11
LIVLSKTQVEAINAHGERDYPYECCGLLIGRFNQDGVKEVVEIYPISNAREEEAKRNRFLIRPEELLRGERFALHKNLDVVGFYHSHPDDKAVPSTYDLEHAWPTYSYIVVSVREGEATDFLSWEMEASREKFNPEEIQYNSELHGL